MNTPENTQFSLKEKGIDWQFWTLWIVANAVGIITGLFVFTNLTVKDSSWFAGAIIGGTVGVAQWLVLRRKLSILIHWILVSIIGAGIGWLGAKALLFAGTIITYLSFWGLLSDYGQYDLQNGTEAKSAFFIPELAPTLALCGATIGIFIGLSQWLVLRRRIQHAKWWIWINTVCFSFAGLLSSSIAYSNYDVDLFLRWKTVEVIQGLSGFVGLAIVGILLIWLLQSSVRKIKFGLLLTVFVIILGVSIPLSLIAIGYFNILTA